MNGPNYTPPSRIDDLLCFLVHSTGAAFNRSFRKPLERLGLTYPQHLVMLTLWAHDGLTVGEIGDRLRQDSNTLTPLLKRMEELGHVTRTRCTLDERRVIVRLTESGRRLQADVGDVLGYVRNSIGLDEAEMLDLMNRLRSLRDNLEAAAELAGVETAESQRG